MLLPPNLQGAYLLLPFLYSLPQTSYLVVAPESMEDSPYVVERASSHGVKIVPTTYIWDCVEAGGWLHDGTYILKPKGETSLLLCLHSYFSSSDNSTWCLLLLLLTMYEKRDCHMRQWTQTGFLPWRKQGGFVNSLHERLTVITNFRSCYRTYWLLLEGRAGKVGTRAKRKGPTSERYV